MAIIKPFKGVRPPQDLVEQVASRPYDVLNSAEAREEAKGNEKSLYHIIKPEIDFPVGTDEHDECVYQKAAENFQMFQDKGWLVQDDKENYYVYAQTMNGKTQYGLVVGAYVPDYMNGVIKKHELTRRDKEEDRMKHVRVNNANIEPVLWMLLSLIILPESQCTTLSLPAMVSDILSGLLINRKILMPSLRNLLRCLPSTLPTDIIVVLPPLWWELKKRSRILIIPVTKNTTTSWLFASPPTN